MVGLVAEVEEPYGRGAEAAQVPLTVGLFVEAQIEGLQVEGVRLPREALRSQPGTETQVMVVEEGSRLRFRSVSLLQRTDASILVGEGLEEGERVCISPLETPVDGMTVRTVDPQEGAEAAHERHDRLVRPQ